MASADYRERPHWLACMIEQEWSTRDAATGKKLEDQEHRREAELAALRLRLGKIENLMMGVQHALAIIARQYGLDLKYPG